MSKEVKNIIFGAALILAVVVNVVAAVMGGVALAYTLAVSIPVILFLAIILFLPNPLRRR